jgi:hypothetical protein
MKHPLLALFFCLLLPLTLTAQTRGAVALTVGLNSNLGNAQGNLGGLGTFETRKDRFGFSATGHIGQLRKNLGGSGTEGGGEADARYFFHRDVFLAGGLGASGYSVQQFGKSAVTVTAGVGVSKPLYTLTAQYGHDVSGVTRRNLFITRVQVYTNMRAYLDVQAGVVHFNQQGPQTGFALRLGIGIWFGGTRQ